MGLSQRSRSDAESLEPLGPAEPWTALPPSPFFMSVMPCPSTCVARANTITPSAHAATPSRHLLSIVTASAFGPNGALSSGPILGRQGLPSQGEKRSRPGHDVERGAAAEPVQLAGGKRVVQPQGFARPVGVTDAALDGLAGGQARQADQAQAVVLADPVVVGRILERQREQPLLLEVRLVDAGEAARDDGGAAQQARAEGGVLAARALAVVLVADHDPLHALAAVVLRDGGDGLRGLAGEHVLALAGLAGVGVDRPHERVLAELLEVTPVAEPGAGRRDV